MQRRIILLAFATALLSFSIGCPAPSESDGGVDLDDSGPGGDIDGGVDDSHDAGQVSMVDGGSNDADAGNASVDAGSDVPPEGYLPYFEEALDDMGQTHRLDLPGTFCRDGNPAAFGLRLMPQADVLMIRLAAGGACFNAPTCGSNNDSISPNSTPFVSGGTMSPPDPADPFSGPHSVGVPYCTGDVHAGFQNDVNVPGVSSPQQFVGGRNMEILTQALVDFFEANPELAPDSVILTGGSAGGFGSTFNYYQVATKFDPVPVHLVTDSGNLFPDSDVSFAPCLQQTMRTLWGFNDKISASCPECVGADGGGLVHLQTYLPDLFPNGTFAMLGFEEDSILRYYFEFGMNQCAGGDLSGPAFAQGLLALRDDFLVPTGRWSTYFIPTSGHIAFGGSYTVDGRTLDDFLIDSINGNIEQVGP